MAAAGTHLSSRHHRSVGLAHDLGPGAHRRRGDEARRAGGSKGNDGEAHLAAVGIEC